MNIAFRGTYQAPDIGTSPLLNQHLPAFTEGGDLIQRRIQTEAPTLVTAGVYHDDKGTHNPNDDVYVSAVIDEETGKKEFREIPVIQSNITPDADKNRIIKFLEKLAETAIAFPLASQA